MPLNALKQLAMHCKSVLMVSLVMGLVACGGGGSTGSTGTGGSTGISDGTQSSPTDIAVSTPYATSVDSGDSYYVVSGLTPGNYYAIRAYGATADITLYGYDDSSFSFETCSSDRPGTLDEACSTVPDPNGNIYIRVSGANSGGGADFLLTVMPATVNQGAASTPLDITATPSLQGITLAGSYYVITGLTPGQRYTVALGNVLYNPELKVYQHKAFDHPVCTSTNAAWAGESCAAAGNFEGKLYIKVTANNGSNLNQMGAYYTISVTQAPGTELIFEGYSDAPIDLTGKLPYTGQINRRESYYTISGLTPGTKYEIRMDYPSADNQLSVFPDEAYSGPLCSASYYFSSPTRKSCVATAPSSGSLYIEVPFTAAASYTLDVVLAPVAEGSSTAPLAINSGYNAQVDTTTSYYEISGLTPDTNYKVDLSDVSDNSLTVMAGSSTSLSASTDISTGRTDSSGNLYILIDGSGTSGNGAWFTLSLATANNPEGSASSPVDITTSTPAAPYSGQVDNRTSYYKITGLTPGNYYMTHIEGYTDSVTVSVYDNNTYTSPSLCSIAASPFSTSIDNHCLAPVPSGGTLYISVNGPSSILGTKYTLWMEPSLIKSEGVSASVISPVPITLDTAYAGMVSNYATDSSSYYSVTGLTGGAAYNIALADTTDDVHLTVYSDSAYTTEVCRSHRQGLYDEHCVATAPGSGSNQTLYIKVAASLRIDASSHVTTYDGATYTLTVSGGATAIANDGTPSAPLAVASSSLPYSGKVKASPSTPQSSYYKVAGLTASANYSVQVTNESGPVDMYAGSDSTFATNDCFEPSSFEPVNHACISAADGSGNLYIQISGTAIADATYKINVVWAPVAEGTAGAPKDITNLTRPYAGQVDGTKSYYTRGSLTPGASYQVSLSNLTETARVGVYSDNSFSSSTASSTADNNVTSIVGTADGSGILYLAADGSQTYSTGSGAFFDIDVRPAPQSEGSIAAPVAITLQTPYAGQKAYNGTSDSYYKVSGLVPFSSHRVTLRNRSMTASITVYDSPDFTHQLCYGSSGDYRTGCAAAANYNGDMYIEVGDTGGFYNLYVP
jgi:hypothetical protein